MIALFAGYSTEIRLSEIESKLWLGTFDSFIVPELFVLINLRDFIVIKFIELWKVKWSLIFMCWNFLRRIFLENEVKKFICVYIEYEYYDLWEMCVKDIASRVYLEYYDVEYLLRLSSGSMSSWDLCLILFTSSIL